MRIGLDGIPLAAPRTGIGHYSYELARSLARVAPADEFQLVSPVPFAALSREEIASLPTNLRVVSTEARGLKRRWWTIGAPLYVNQSALDLFHGTNYCVPLWNRCRTVVTIHDLTLFLYPETFQQHVLRRARRRLPVMARAATVIITPSESVRREVCEHLGVKAERVVAVPEAARRIFRPVRFEKTLEARRRLGVEDDFVLFVGTIEPRKNLLTLVRAFEEVLREMGTRPPQLVIVGKVGWQSDDLYSYVEKSGMSERVRFTGYVSEEDLCALYSSCRACVYPSLYEGFGLPPLEAMACGAPVVTSRIASIEETVGRAARLVDPTDVRALAQAIIELLKSEAQRQHFSVAGVERAAQFTWEKTAQTTLEVYDLALSNAASKPRSFAWRRGSGKMVPVRDHEVTIENLVHKINEGARRRAIDSGDRKNPTASPSLVEVSALEEPLSSQRTTPSQDVDRAPLTSQSAPSPHNGDHYRLSDLVRYDDQDFVQNSYRAILKRPPDPDGFESYLDGLRQGNLDKVGVLLKLRFSTEGRAKRVRVKGLLLPALSRGVRRLPVVGYLAQVGAGLARLPAIVHRQRQLEARIFTQEREKRMADLRAEELSKSLDSAHTRVTETHARVTETHARVSETLRCLSEVSETLTAQQRQINNLRTDSNGVRDEMRARVVELGERISRLREQLILDETAQLSAPYDSHPSHIPTNEKKAEADHFYAEFTDAFRGVRADIKERLKIYLPIIEASGIGTYEMPILDVGCGRGEWLELLRDEGLKAVGVDSNRLFVACCRARGLDVVEGELLSHLRTLPSAGLGAVTSFHVIEHLRPEALMEMLDEAARVLKPGGAIILETPNPKNILTATYYFHLDPSHHKPLPPATMKFFLESKDFTKIELMALHPATGEEVEGETDLARRFNELFYGAMDYAIIGWKAAE